MKKPIKATSSALLISLLFLASCGVKKYSQITDSNSESNDVYVESDFSKPVAPQNLSFDPETNTLSWTAVTGAVGYDVICNGHKSTSTIKTNKYKLPDNFLADADEYLIGVRTVGTDNVKSNYTVFSYNSKDEATSTNIFTYEVDYTNNECAINGLSPLATLDDIRDMEMGGQFNGMNITKIADGAFLELNKLTNFNVTILPSIKVIGAHAFERSYVTKINFNEGLEEIGENAFNNASQLNGSKEDSNVKLPNSLKIIGDNAFSTCMALTSVVLNENSLLEKIGSNAFYRSKLTTFDLPSSVNELGEGAFSSCSSLTSFNFLGTTSLASLPASCFSGTVLREFYLPDQIEEIGKSCFEFSSSNNNFKSFYYTSDSNLKTISENAFANLSQNIYFGIQTSGEQPSGVINLPKTLEVIGNSAFKGGRYTTVSCPNDSKLNKIGDNAFSGVTTLKEITLPSSLKEIGDSAFSGDTVLETVTMPNDISLDVLYSNSFKDTSYIKSFDSTNRIIIAKSLYALASNETSTTDLDLSNSNVNTISGKLFENKTLLKTLKLNDGLLNINDSAFSGCTSLTQINIPESVINIGNNAFYNCSRLATLTLGNQTTAKLETIGDGAFSNNISITEFVLPDNVRTIGNEAFEVSSTNVNNLKLERFIISNNSKLETIGANAFNNQNKITEINIPNSVKTINDSAFVNCTNLTNINIDMANSTLEIIGNSAFENTKVENINIPGTITYLGNAAFKKCSSLTNIEFGNGAFTNWNVNDNTNESDEEDEENVPTIFSETFASCSSLVAISLPENIKTIEDNAFLDAKELVTITSSATKIGNLAFANTAFEKSFADGVVEHNGIVLRYIGDGSQPVDLREGLKINAGAFADSALVIINLPSSLPIIDDYAFEDCTNLTTVNIDDDAQLTEIGTNAFNGCTNLKLFNFTSKIEKIAENAFNRCLSLTEVDLSKTKLTEISSNAFANCNNLSSVKLNNGLETIGEYAFYQTALKDLVIKSSITTINSHAFARIGKANNNRLDPVNWEITPSLETLTFENNSKLNHIGSYAFENNIIKTITLPSNDGMKLDEYCFANSRRIEEFTIEFGFETLEGVISGASNLKKLEIPGNIQIASIFGGKISMIPTTLRSVTIADDSEAITDNAFSGLGMVEKFIIPNTVTTIGDYAFYGCRSIKSINLESITSIGNNAFNGCVNLENISFGKALEYIGDKALFATKYLNLKDDVQFVILDDILIQYNGTDTNVTIPSQVKAISGGAFSGNQTVTEITLSSNTKLLCNGAFDSCSKLSKITIPYDGVVEIELGVFDTLSSNLKIYVKNGKLNEYKNDIHWSLYEDYLA